MLLLPRLGFELKINALTSPLPRQQSSDVCWCCVLAVVQVRVVACAARFPASAGAFAESSGSPPASPWRQPHLGASRCTPASTVRSVFVLCCAARPTWLAVQLERGGGGAGMSLEERQRLNEPWSHLHFVSHVHTSVSASSPPDALLSAL